MENRLDIIIFGAIGFAGIHVIPYVFKLTKTHGRNLSWGVSGRSHEKLSKILKETGKKINADFSKIPIITADISNHQSLVKMASRARVIINCCGPYRTLGEPVVKACIEATTHYVDITGEPLFIESMQFKYHDKAKEKGIYMISACGMDCIPTDLGLVFIEREFDGTLNQVVSYLNIYVDHPKNGPKFKGPTLNYGTWESAVESVGDENLLKELRRRNPKNVPNLKPKLPSKILPHISSVENHLAVPFMGADKFVMLNSQYFSYKEENKRPIQVETYVLMTTFFFLLFYSFLGGIFLLLARFQWGRNLLLKYPRFFSGGYCSKENPSEETVQNTCIELTLIGEGWKEKLSAIDARSKQSMDSSIIVKVKGKNPAYGITCFGATLCAIMILTEAHKLPPKGGVYPPGYAFGKTRLIKELHENGLTFEVISKKSKL